MTSESNKGTIFAQREAKNEGKVNQIEKINVKDHLPELEEEVQKDCSVKVLDAIVEANDLPDRLTRCVSPTMELSSPDRLICHVRSPK